MFRANRMLRVCMSKNKEQITFYEYVCQRTKSNSHVTSMYVKEQRANHMLRVCMSKNKEQITCYEYVCQRTKNLHQLFLISIWMTATTIDN